MKETKQFLKFAETLLIKMKTDLITGARPNFVKIAAIIHAIEHSESDIEYRLIHTGATL